MSFRQCSHHISTGQGTKLNKSNDKFLLLTIIDITILPSNNPKTL